MRTSLFLRTIAASILEVICLFLTFSCIDQVQSEWPEDVSFTTEDADTIQLNAEIVNRSYDFISAKRFFVYSDSVLVVINKSEENKPLVQFANLRTGEELGRTLMYGNGPIEALMANPFIVGDILYVKDAARSRLISIDIPSILSNPSDFHPEVVDDFTDYPAVFVIPLDGETMVYENSYCFEDRESGYVNEGQDRLLFAPRGEHGTIRIGNPKYDTYNVSQGYIVPFKEKNRIFYSSLSLPLIEIYDCSGERIKRLSGPTSLAVDYGIRDGSVLFNGKLPYTYLHSCRYEDSFFANYVGGYFKGSYSDLHSTIMQFNTDGVLQRSFISPVFLSSFSISSDGVFYGQGYDETETVVLWKLTPLEKQ